MAKVDDPDKARYVDALRAIAGGQPDPERVARAALEGTPAKPGPRARTDRWIPIDCILSNSQVRATLGRGRKPISRSTLILWRKHRGFPEPFMTLPGQGAADVELWDRRSVRQWKRKNLGRA